jgi:hypothetical protein
VRTSNPTSKIGLKYSKRNARRLHLLEENFRKVEETRASFSKLSEFDIFACENIIIWFLCWCESWSPAQTEEQGDEEDVLTYKKESNRRLKKTGQ